MSQAFDFSQVNKAAQQDILELDRRIKAYQQGREDEERFKLYRLTRGVYGQRQVGVQMFRLKIPFGRITADQLVRVADVSEKYTNGNLHLTTRQNIQLHYVKLNDSPAIWTELAQAGLTAREACGNTVRNLTASAKAGIDPYELFDVSPYVQAAFEYFLRNPICQDMGRKIKPAFSSSDQDSAFTYFHDFGFIPRVRHENGREVRGFKVVIGGGLGAVSMVAHTACEFLEEELIIPFMEACLRVFDRYGEREKRMKARMKFLIQKIGFDAFMDLVELEKLALKNKRVPIDREAAPQAVPAPAADLQPVSPADQHKYELWLGTNVFEQKQSGFFAVQIRVPLGNIHAGQARDLAQLVRTYAADDIRITVNQGLLIKFLRKEALPHVFNELQRIGFGEPGFDTIADVTACPGTDTCALGVTNSTGLASRLSEVITEEYPDLINETNIKIKISGCMNSCGQHMAANIGFHGSSFKSGALVIPAMQVVIGGGVDPQGNGFIAEKVIKVPTRRAPDVLRTLLNDYESNAEETEYFNDYYYRQGKRYFYDLLKALADKDGLQQIDFFDWGQDQAYEQAIGVGECAGVTLDVVSTIIADAQEKIQLGHEALAGEAYADSIYHSYAAFVIGAKALLLSRDVKCNTHKGIIDDFDEHYVATGEFPFSGSFAEQVLQIRKHEPGKEFAATYLEEASRFMEQVLSTRRAQLIAEGGVDKLVVDNYYKA